MLIPASTAIVDIAEFSSGGGVDAAIDGEFVILVFMDDAAHGLNPAVPVGAAQDTATAHIKHVLQSSAHVNSSSKRTQLS